MQITCPNCHNIIPATDIVLEKDLAKCHECNEIWKLEELMKLQNSIQQYEPFPPAYGKIRMEEELDSGQVKIILPPKGFGLETIGLGVFTTFWLGFISFWTWGASQASLLFAAFSIPFWLVGIGMAGLLLNNIIGSQSIVIKDGKIEVRKDFFPFPKRFSFFTPELRSIAFQKEEYRGFVLQNSKSQSNTTMKDTLVIKTETQKIVCFEGISTEEGEWLKQYLKEQSGLKQ